MRQVWWNGKIIPESEAKVSIYDSSLMFGDCVFEMTRSFNGKQFKLEEHIDRLFKSIKYLEIPMELSKQDVLKACKETQLANKFDKGDEHRLMINVTRGTLPMYHETGNVGTNVIIADFPLRWTVAGMGSLFEEGINAFTPSQRAIPAHLLEPKVKHRSRIHFLKANIEASRLEGKNNWPILQDEDGYLTEGTGCNFFIVHRGMPITPMPKTILSGISRSYIFELSPCGQADFNAYDVMNDADEAFVTATPFCMLPVTSFNGQPIGDGKVGPVFKDILKKWSDNVGVDIKKQIQSWEGSKGGTSTYGFKRA